MFQATQLWEGEHLSQVALMQYHQGTLPNPAWLESDAHLLSCEACQARLEQLAENSEVSDAAILALKQAMFRENIETPLPRIGPFVANFPSFEVIKGYVNGTLSSREVADFEVALARFPTLAKQVDDLRAIHQELQSSSSDNPLPTPPMIVKAPAQATPSSKRWWEKLIWVLPSFGTAAGAAALLFLIVISPLKEKLIESARNQQSLQAQIAVQQSKDKELRARQQKQQKQAQRVGDTLARQLAIASQRLKDAAAESTRKNAEIQRLKQVSPTGSTSRPPSSTPVPLVTPTPHPAPADDSGVQVPLRDVIVSQRDKSLYETAPKSRDGGGDNPKFRALSPVATKIRELHPLLRWSNLPKATRYEVSLRDETTKEAVTSSQPATTNPWRVPYTLIRGHRYTWQVVAKANESTIAQAPIAPQPLARFEILSEGELASLEKDLQGAKTNVPQQILILSAAGLTEEAQDKLDALQKQPFKSK